MHELPLLDSMLFLFSYFIGYILSIYNIIYINITYLLAYTYNLTRTLPRQCILTYNNTYSFRRKVYLALHMQLKKYKHTLQNIYNNIKQRLQ